MSLQRELPEAARVIEIQINMSHMDDKGELLKCVLSTLCCFACVTLLLSYDWSNDFFTIFWWQQKEEANINFASMREEVGGGEHWERQKRSIQAIKSIL